jgi:hypothetical protein
LVDRRSEDPSVFALAVRATSHNTSLIILAVHRRFVVASLFMMAAAACGSEPAAPPEAEILDSAGVRVVLNAAPETAPLWSVFEEPLLEIGGNDNDPSQTLFQVRGAVRLSDGMIVVANGGSLQLRWYDPSGLHVRTAGGKGDGPGELMDLSLVGLLPGDSIVIRDIRHRTIPVYDRMGQLVRTHRLSSEFGAFPNAVGVLNDGSVLLAPQSPRLQEDAPGAGGFRRETGVVVVAGPDGLERRVLGEHPAGEGTCLPARIGCRAAFGQPFGRSLYWSAAGDRIALATSDSFSIRILDGHGAPIHIIRQRREPMKVRKQDYDRERDTLLAFFSPGLRKEVEQAVDAMPRQETYPFFRGIRLDRAGDLWVEESRRRGADRPVWQVFGRDGLLIGRVQAPDDGLILTDSGPDYLLGVYKDDRDVEKVRLYRLER